MSPMKSKNCKINQLDANGKETGLWREYYGNGKLRYEGNYIAGKQIGLWRGYYGNGKLWYEGNYIAGKATGLWRGYYDNGKLMYEGNYINGLKHGIWKEGKIRRTKNGKNILH